MHQSTVTKLEPPKEICDHRRVPVPALVNGKKRLKCTCGEVFEVSFSDPRVSNIKEAEEAVDQMFLKHLPSIQPDYILVDQRQKANEDSSIYEPVGNFLMPEGVPCRITDHWEKDGIRYAKIDQPREDTLPVGEIRTADGKVFILGW